jgi:hypothetical protein
MGLRMGLIPDGRPHRFDFDQYAENMAVSMMDMRRLVNRQEYSGHLLRKLLIQVYPIQYAWDALDKCFTVGQQEVDIEHAFVTTERIIQMYEVLVAAEADSLLSRGVETGGISFELLSAWARSASRGDNSLMEELEFACVCFSARRAVFSRWAALGLSGINKESAYVDLVDYWYYDDERSLNGSQLLETFSDASVCFGMSIAASMGGGFSSNGGASASPGAYRPLPPLW